MGLAIGVLRGTPIWVFVLFGYLVFRGVQALQRRVRSTGRIWIIPCFFIAWGLADLLELSGAFPTNFAHWLIGAALGCVIGGAFRISLQADRQHKRVLLPASILPLVRYLVLFGASYGLHVAAAMQPDTGAKLMLLDLAVSGAGAGYFVAWSLRFVVSYRNALDVDLDPEPFAHAERRRV